MFSSDSCCVEQKGSQMSDEAALLAVTDKGRAGQGRGMIQV
jgi:hypothetical protein